jgi:hypothetical protein
MHAEVSLKLSQNVFTTQRLERHAQFSTDPTPEQLIDCFRLTFEDHKLAHAKLVAWAQQLAKLNLERRHATMLVFVQHLEKRATDG